MADCDCGEPATMLWDDGEDYAFIHSRFFWTKVAKTDGCWLWTGSRFVNGYGQMRVRKTGLNVQAHRFSWSLHQQADPPLGMFVCHHCDNRQCVRPDHLFLGDHAANMRDMAQKGRASRHRGAVTHCPRGHAYDGPSVPGQKRDCRVCHRLASRHRKRKKRGWSDAKCAMHPENIYDHL